MESDIADEIWALTEAKAQVRGVIVIEALGDCSTTYVFPCVEDMIAWEKSNEPKIETVTDNSFFHFGGSFDDL
jgi:hypothetical protein